jgi:hypothetical protein|tara:strand:- start:424 stop:966 length:543 start_codon:yes stop_codon:yes gene_type:complete
MGGVTFDNRIIATEGGSGGTDSPPWEELVFNTDFLLHSDTSNITSNITISDSRYWKYGKHVTLVMNFNLITNSNVPSNTKNISFVINNSELIAESSVYRNYCSYDRTLSGSETLGASSHPMMAMTLQGLVFKKPEVSVSDQDGTITIDGVNSANIITFGTDGIGNNQTYNFKGQITFNSV